ncbi:MAG: hypothetical protein IT427_06160 [Pirellulales bacterium]|nr:hypothetical protein [Pirellulales bacterium]
MKKRPLSRDERRSITYGILSVVVVIVLLQLWLLTATMNAYLGGDDTVVWPAAAASLICFGLNGGLLWYLYSIERTVETSDGDSP